EAICRQRASSCWNCSVDLPVPGSTITLGPVGALAHPAIVTAAAITTIVFMAQCTLLLVLAELQRVLALRPTNRHRASEIEAQRLEHRAQAVADGIRQRPVVPGHPAPRPAPHRFLDHALRAQAPERNARDRHAFTLRRKVLPEPRGGLPHDLA